KITDIEKKRGQKRRRLLATIEDKNGNSFQTILDYVFILGDAEPYISLPEVD
nr:30S ribosomal protein S4e [Candidatus Bathyarchaeota archaeon]